MKKVVIVAAALFAFASFFAGAAEISLEQALQIALSENTSVKVADMEIEKTGYARKGTYSSLYPQINGTGSYQRTIKKQVMYMDVQGMEDGLEVGRFNTWSAGVSASMPLVNVQLWQSLKISDQDVELAVEKARGSRLEVVTQVKKAYFAVLLAKQVFKVYREVYENAVVNLEQTQRKYNAQRASELDLARAKTNVANAIPEVFNSENAAVLGLWQLKAVMGVDLSSDIDVAGSLEDYSAMLAAELDMNEDYSLDSNSTMRQLSIQAEELANTIKLQQAANIPTLALSFSYSFSAMANDYNFSEYKWSPYSYAGLSLSIPIFAGFKRSNAIKQARVQAGELDAQRTNTERQLRISIRQSLGTMDTAVKTYESARSALETSRKAYDIAVSSYNVGRSTLTDLNDAQLALTQTQLSVTRAVYSYLVAKTELEGVLGTEKID